MNRRISERLGPIRSGLLAAAAAGGLPGAAAAGAEAVAWRFPPGTSVQAPIPVWWSGRPGVMQSFDAHGTPAVLAASFGAQRDAAPVLQAMPDGVLLSGMQGDTHWLLVLQQRADGRTRGLASNIRLGAAPELPAPDWLPIGGTLLLDVATDTGAARRQYVIAFHADRVALDAALCAALHRRGWRPEGGDAGCLHAAASLSAWASKGRRLQVVVTGDAGARSWAVVSEQAPGGAGERSMQ